MTIHEALRAHTMGAAYAAHEEKIKGSIEAGKFADVTVWTEDPYNLPLQRLYNATIDLTMVGGNDCVSKDLAFPSALGGALELGVHGLFVNGSVIQRKIE